MIRTVQSTVQSAAGERLRLSELTDTATDAVRAAGTYLSDLATPRVRLGVTGLSRAGKTVFIAALVQALTEGGARPPLTIGHLPGFRAFLEPQPDDDIPRFAYEQHLATLRSGGGQWPQSTRQISQLRLTCEWAPTDWARQMAGITRALHIDIIDYPGEWLLDLALLDQSYAAWSEDMHAFARRRARDGRVEDWLRFCAEHNLIDAGDETVAIAGAECFRAFLRSVREHDRFARMISPGRFLLPGDLDGSPLLTFFPLAGADGDSNRAGTLGAMLERRFEAYKAHVVKPFFERHFKSLDRQIVLVDMLGALNGGPDAVEELETCLLSALNAFRPGAQRWLAAVLGRRIDKVLFAATKADHVHASSHDRLRAALDVLVRRASQRADEAGADFAVTRLASLRATEDVDYRVDGDLIPCIRGIPIRGETVGTKRADGEASAAVFPGELPPDPYDIFDRDALAAGELNFVRFRPPTSLAQVDPAPRVWPHIGLDEALRYLLGDRLV